MIESWLVRQRPFEYEYEYRSTEYEYEEDKNSIIPERPRTPIRDLDPCTPDMGVSLWGAVRKNLVPCV